MLPFYTFTRIPPFFLFGFKHGGHRHPDKSYKILKPTIWALSFKEIPLTNLDEYKLRIYYPDANYYMDVETDDYKTFANFLKNDAQINPKYLENNLIKEIHKYEPQNESLNIIDFKIHSETNMSSPDSWYYTSIGIIGNRVTADTPTMVFCSCPDFRYTFAYVLHKYGALLYDEEFPIEFKTIPPKKRNPYQIPWACKHVYTIARYIFENRDKFEFSEDFVKRFNLRNNQKARPKLGLLIEIEKLISNLKQRYRGALKIILGKK
jgi:hypothetical protein